MAVEQQPPNLNMEDLEVSDDQILETLNIIRQNFFLSPTAFKSIREALETITRVDFSIKVKKDTIEYFQTRQAKKCNQDKDKYMEMFLQEINSLIVAVEDLVIYINKEPNLEKKLNTEVVTDQFLHRIFKNSPFITSSCENFTQKILLNFQKSVVFIRIDNF